MFEGPDGKTVKGIVVRKNRKTVTVHCTADERQWNVSPSLLRPSGEHALDEFNSYMNKVLPFGKGERK